MHFGMPFASFLAAVLVLVPLPAHWRAKNIATLSIIAWLFVINVMQGVNAILWAHSVEIQAVVWCDITTRVFIGSNIGLSAACFSLCMNLERVAAVRTVRTMKSDKRRRLIFDCGICFLVPAIYTGLYYVVQGHRFDIVEDFGCRPETYVSIPEFFIIRLPPILLDIGTLIFSTMALIHFIRRRATFMTHLANTKSSLTPSRYMRLMAMAVVEMFWDLLISIMNMTFSYRSGLRPWISWADVHSNFSRIGLFPTLLIPPADLRMTVFLWWAIPASAYLFFLFFAFGQDAMNEYRGCMRLLCRIILRRELSATVSDKIFDLPRFSPISSREHTLPLPDRQRKAEVLPPPAIPGWKDIDTIDVGDAASSLPYSLASPSSSDLPPHYEESDSASGERQNRVSTYRSVLHPTKKVGDDLDHSMAEQD